MLVICPKCKSSQPQAGMSKCYSCDAGLPMPVIETDSLSFEEALFPDEVYFKSTEEVTQDYHPSCRAFFNPVSMAAAIRAELSKGVG